MGVKLSRPGNPVTCAASESRACHGKEQRRNRNNRLNTDAGDRQILRRRQLSLLTSCQQQHSGCCKLKPRETMIDTFLILSSLTILASFTHN
jgi:hypothetical protein